MINLYTHSLYPQQRVLAYSLLLVVFLLFGTSSLSSAESIPEPQKLMEDTSREMIQAFMDNLDAIRKDHEIAHKLINDSLVPKINFKLMSRWVLGRNWKAATAQQQKEFMQEFKELVVEFYSRALIQYLEKNELTDGIISFKPFRGKPKSKYATVHSLVHPPGGGESIKVNYDLYFSKKGVWQIYDVSLEGISLVTTYRSSFNQIIKKKGMDALLSELREKNSKLDNPEEKPQVAVKKNKLEAKN